MERQRARYANYYARCKIYEELSNLWAKLIPPSPTSLSQDKLQTLGIQCSVMASCPEEAPDSGPRFCTLVPPSTMSNAFDSIFPSKKTWWPGSDPEDDSNFYTALALGCVLLDYSISGQDIQEPLIDTEWYTTGDSTRALTLHRSCYPNTRSQWGVHRILRVNNTHQPHLACVHIDDALPEEGLRPSELISTIKLMKQAIRLDKRAQYCVHPVYVYSISCRKARILETFYEAGTLFVRKTPYIDFTEENEENIKLYLRWMMNIPSGFTTFASRNDANQVSNSFNDAKSNKTHSSKD